jgi:hypothetical protein
MKRWERLQRKALRPLLLRRYLFSNSLLMNLELLKQRSYSKR